MKEFVIIWILAVEIWGSPSPPYNEICQCYEWGPLGVPAVSVFKGEKRDTFNMRFSLEGEAVEFNDRLKKDKRVRSASMHHGTELIQKWERRTYLTGSGYFVKGDSCTDTIIIK